MIIKILVEMNACKYRAYALCLAICIINIHIDLVLFSVLKGTLDDLKKPAEEAAPKKEKIKAPTGLPVELEKAWNDEFAAQFQKYLHCT